MNSPTRKAVARPVFLAIDRYRIHNSRLSRSESMTVLAEVHVYAIRQLVKLPTLIHYTASVIRQRSFTVSDSEEKFAHRPIYE